MIARYLPVLKTWKKLVIGSEAGYVRDEFVSEYSVPWIIIQYEGLSRFLFSFRSGLAEPSRVLDISGCFLNLDHIHCSLSMFCSPFVL